MNRFEHHKEPLISRKAFFHRMAGYAGYSMLILFLSLLLGILGYKYFAHLSWIDALLNASMILTGMGPVDQMPTDAAKLFASFYALYGGVAFLTTSAVLLAPLVHRLLHILHVESSNDAAG
jgi:hypothetical protein